MKHILLSLLAVLSLSACSSSKDAERALKSAGFTDIQSNGYAIFGCADSDTFATKFVATNPRGERVTGVVCSGWLKGATIRYD